MPNRLGSKWTRLHRSYVSEYPDKAPVPTALFLESCQALFDSNKPEFNRCSVFVMENMLDALSIYPQRQFLPDLTTLRDSIFPLVLGVESWQELSDLYEKAEKSGNSIELAAIKTKLYDLDANVCLLRQIKSLTVTTDKSIKRIEQVSNEDQLTKMVLEQRAEHWALYYLSRKFPQRYNQLSKKIGSDTKLKKQLRYALQQSQDTHRNNIYTTASESLQIEDAHSYKGFF